MNSGSFGINKNTNSYLIKSPLNYDIRNQQFIKGTLNKFTNHHIINKSIMCPETAFNSTWKAKFKVVDEVFRFLIKHKYIKLWQFLLFFCLKTMIFKDFFWMFNYLNNFLSKHISIQSNRTKNKALEAEAKQERIRWLVKFNYPWDK